MPSPILVELDCAQQAWLRASLRRFRLLCPLLRLHILLLLAQRRSPTEIADWLLCSRSTVYDVAQAWHDGWRPWERTASTPKPALPSGLTPTLHRSLRALLNSTPAAYGWCRTRWSCATLAATLQARRGLAVSAETLRRWLHGIGWVWKRAKLVAKDNDPERVSKLARIRLIWESLRPREALLFADELDIALLPKPGYQWMEKGTQVQVMTPGKNEKRYLAGAWDVRTGQVHHRVWARKTNALFRDLLDALDTAYPARCDDRIFVVVDNYRIHKAQAVEKWLTAHRRFELVWLPTYCPRANPIERIFGDTHDKVTRNHRRKRLRDLVADVVRHLQGNGPWHYQRSALYDEPEVITAMARLQRCRKAA